MAPLQAEERKPRTKAELIALLKERGEAIATWMESLSDDVLAEVSTQPPGATPATKSRFEMIMGAKTIGRIASAGRSRRGRLRSPLSGPARPPSRLVAVGCRLLHALITSLGRCQTLENAAGMF